MNVSPRPSLRDGKISVARGIARVCAQASERERETKRRQRRARERRRLRE